MHYCLYLYTKEFPTDALIDEMLAPYNEEKFYNEGEWEDKERPVFLWDWWQIGGRYGGKLKLAMTEETIEKYKFRYYERERRAGRLFRCQLLETVSRGVLDTPTEGKVDETDTFQYLGSRDGFLAVDGCWLPDLLNKGIGDECFAVLTDDGTAIAREVWNGDDWVRTDNFDARAKMVMERLEGTHYLTVIDLHD